MQLRIAPLTSDTVEKLADAFAAAPYSKARAQYARYLNAHTRDELVTLVAWAEPSTVCGYVNLLWHSDYPPFERAAIPEINDLNVLVAWRRRGIGTALIGAAESVALRAGRSQVGIGVGVTPDFDAARHLYPRLGYVWDGRGSRPTSYGAVEYLTKQLASDAPGWKSMPSGTRPPLTLDVLAESLSVLRFAPDANVPAWALRAGPFASVTRTADELSVVCATARVPSTPLPAGTVRDDGWHALKVVGPFAFSEVGVLLQVAAPLAAAEISILAMATFDTDYVLVQEAQLARAVAVLRAAGHTVRDGES